MRKTLLLLLISVFAVIVRAQTVDSTEAEIDEIEKTFHYTTGTISLEKGNGTIVVPKGFKFLNGEQSRYVLTDLWGNPKDENIIGMLVPEEKGVLRASSWAFTIMYDPMGYVEDKDASEIDYDEMLAESKKDIEAENASRKEAGYQTADLIGWASKPYYDDQAKVLHWAKEISFEQDSVHTLNYNLRILGRHGIYLINAVAAIDQLPEVQQSIEPVISSISFKEGDRYSDYASGDQIASWTIGSLVAGKVLAKAGFFAVLLKFWKIIAVACVGGFSYVWRKITGRKKEEEEEMQAEENTESSDPTNQEENSNTDSKD
ncbi:DUF2167 domain-containing protein [Sphingobacterium oryzagri]|uniref:DUF2167 domain-containing protein n=1 Tax=Sphingobacterium oryzagri TaxID=3025669 RepID=A0ABY7WD50_9SPHI|nr:DUF2167 domain-containing protein [Sphingobacterium sp. KACC 22765]WDF67579.1 DUF2167 domain-containing protein [Sphingobacterium sp. KACC 22765]